MNVTGVFSTKSRIKGDIRQQDDCISDSWCNAVIFFLTCYSVSLNSLPLVRYRHKQCTYRHDTQCNFRNSYLGRWYTPASRNAEMKVGWPPIKYTKPHYLVMQETC